MQVFRIFPKSILILRLICSLTHLQLSQIYESLYGKLVRFTPYEYGVVNVGRKVGDRLSQIFLENLPKKIDYKDTERRYLLMQERNEKIHGSGNILENEVETILSENKIKFNKDVIAMGGSNIPIEVDFLIPSRMFPKVAIQCKLSRGSGDTAYKASKVLAFDTIELRKKKIELISVIDGRWSKRSVTILKNYCKILDRSELDKLPEMVLVD